MNISCIGSRQLYVSQFYCNGESGNLRYIIIIFNKDNFNLFYTIFRSGLSLLASFSDPHFVRLILVDLLCFVTFVFTFVPTLANSIIIPCFGYLCYNFCCSFHKNINSPFGYFLDNFVFSYYAPRPAEGRAPL